MTLLRKIFSITIASTSLLALTLPTANASMNSYDVNSDKYQKDFEGYVEFDDSGYFNDETMPFNCNYYKAYYNEEKDIPVVVCIPNDNFFYKVPNDENAEKAVEMAKQNSEWTFLGTHKVGNKYVVVSVAIPNDDKAKNYKDAADFAKKLKEVTDVIEFHFYNSIVHLLDEPMKCKQLTYYFDERVNSHTDRETFISNIEELGLDYTIDFGTDYVYLPDDAKDSAVTLVPNGETTIEERFKLMKQIEDELGVVIASGLRPTSAGEELSVEGIEMANNVSGDTNNDGALTVADAAAILQYLGNAEKFPISAQGKFNADISGDGITAADALAVQRMVLQSANK